ncbi:pyridoxal phosphate-dependent aminotransferase [Candidatus Micrarchaeota archaeon]|nr:pyridoxal phosphate-dependent aminotransferase [Candidatus Micrarchaeota archaeon]
MPELSERAKNYTASPVRKIAGMLEKSGFDKSIISFGGGSPSVPPPREVLEYACQKLAENPHLATTYGSTEGLPTVRELIAEDLRSTENLKVEADDIIITAGSTEGLFSAVFALVNPGDEVIFPDPGYFYGETIKLAGAKPARVPVNWKEDFQILPQRLESAITKKTKAVILTSPDNPTGAVQSKENVHAAIDICEDRDIWLITDEAYKDFVYREEYESPRHMSGSPNIVSCCSYSKSISIPGLRIGYAYGDREVINKLNQVKQSTTLIAPRFAQFFVEKFLADHGKVKKKFVAEAREFYKSKMEVMSSALNESGFEFSKPRGGFFFFLDLHDRLKTLRMDDETFCYRLMEKEKLALVPGRFYGKNGEQHVRLTFVSETPERIREGVKRLSSFINKHE